MPNLNSTFSPPSSPRAQKVSFFAPVRSTPPGFSPQSLAGDCQTTPPKLSALLNSHFMQVAPSFGCVVDFGSSAIASVLPIHPDGMNTAGPALSPYTTCG